MWAPLFFGIFFFCISESVVNGKRLSLKDCEYGFMKAHTTTKPQPVQSVHHSANSCQDYARTSSDLKHRSLAPWMTSTVIDPDMFPSRYEQAVCLCDGCIINGVENRSYNSVPIFTKRLFLKKVHSKTEPDKYTLECVQVKVAVACTCAVPKQ